MIEQPQAPRTDQDNQELQRSEVQQATQNERSVHHQTHSSSEIDTLLREIKQLRQDVQFLKQLLEHVQSQL